MYFQTIFRSVLMAVSNVKFLSSFSDDDTSFSDKEESDCFVLNPVIMVHRPCASPKFTTPLKCKDFYSSSVSICRICHEDDSPEKLISPCNCIGSLGLMHRNCLEKWLATSKTDKCEICKYNFNIIYHSKPLWQWFQSGGILGPRGFLGDIICLLVLFPLSLLSVYLCSMGANKLINMHEWQATGLAFLCLLLILAFILWCAVTLRFHYRMFKEWQISNMDIHLVTYQQRRSETFTIEMNNNHGNEYANSCHSENNGNENEDTHSSESSSHEHLSSNSCTINMEETVF